MESRVKWKAEWKVLAKWLEEWTGALSLECGQRSGGETGKREAVDSRMRVEWRMG